MNFSYWENKELIGDNDIVIIGSGITGLSTAIHLKRTSPSLKIFPNVPVLAIGFCSL